MKRLLFVVVLCLVLSPAAWAFERIAPTDPNIHIVTIIADINESVDDIILASGTAYTGNKVTITATNLPTGWTIIQSQSDTNLLGTMFSEKFDDTMKGWMVWQLPFSIVGRARITGRSLAPVDQLVVVTSTQTSGSKRQAVYRIIVRSQEGGLRS